MWYYTDNSGDIGEIYLVTLLRVVDVVSAGSVLAGLLTHRSSQHNSRQEKKKLTHTCIRLILNISLKKNGREKT